MENYEKFGRDMILRDYLALDRTFLANERTLLAYIRTFTGLFASGVGLVNFIDSSVTAVIGYVFIIISPLFAVCGMIKYVKIHKKLKTLVKIGE